MKLPDLFIEQIHLGEKRKDDLDGSRRDACSDGELEKRLRALDESDRDILERYPADRMKAAIEAKLASRAGEKQGARVLSFPRYAAVRYLSLAAAVCCVALVSFVTMRTASRSTDIALIEGTAVPEISADRVKGDGPRLFIWRQQGANAELLADGSKARVNDILQMSYSASGDLWGAIVSVDGRGIVTQHYPDTGNQAARLSGDGETVLAFSYQLDDAPRYERFIFFSSNEPFSTVEIKTLLSVLAKSDQSGTFALTQLTPTRARAYSILLRK
jgi:hypothetical protein